MGFVTFLVESTLHHELPLCFGLLLQSLPLVFGHRLMQERSPNPGQTWQAGM